MACGRSPAARSQPSVMRRASSGCRDLKHQWRAGITMPDFGGINAMPVRALAARQQKIDRGRSGAAVDLPRIAERLAEMTAFRMRLELEQPDDVAGAER